MDYIKQLDDLNDFIVELKHNQNTYFEYQKEVYRVTDDVQDYIETYGRLALSNIRTSEDPLKGLLENNLVEYLYPILEHTFKVGDTIYAFVCDDYTDRLYHYETCEIYKTDKDSAYFKIAGNKVLEIPIYFKGSPNYPKIETNHYSVEVFVQTEQITEQVKQFNLMEEIESNLGCLDSKSLQQILDLSNKLINETNMGI